MPIDGKTSSQNPPQADEERAQDADIDDRPRLFAERREIELVGRFDMDGGRHRGVARHGRPQFRHAALFHLLDSHHAAVDENPSQQERPRVITGQDRGHRQIQPPDELSGRIVVAGKDQQRQNQRHAHAHRPPDTLQTIHPIVIPMGKQLPHELRMRPQHPVVENGDHRQAGRHQHPLPGVSRRVGVGRMEHFTDKRHGKSERHQPARVVGERPHGVLRPAKMGGRQAIGPARAADQVQGEKEQHGGNQSVSDGRRKIDRVGRRPQPPTDVPPDRRGEARRHERQQARAKCR